MAVPYQIRTPRLLIRCYHPLDAPLLKTAVDESLIHLRHWMPWAQYEPTSLEVKVQRLRMMRGQFDLDQDYTYGIFSADQQRLLGGTGLHKRLGPRALEIGYWIHVRETGQGYATEVAAALVKTAFECTKVDWLEIRCDPNNLASLAVPRKLGFVHEATLRKRDLTPLNQPRDTMIWTIFREDYLNSELTKQELEWQDACGHGLNHA